MLAILEAHSDLPKQISPYHPDTMAQVAHAVFHEQARTLADMLLRRLTIGISATREREGAEVVAPGSWPTFRTGTTRVRHELADLDQQLAHGVAPTLDGDPRPLSR